MFGGFYRCLGVCFCHHPTWVPSASGGLPATVPRAWLPPLACAAACLRYAPGCRPKVSHRVVAAGAVWRFLSMFGCVFTRSLDVTETALPGQGSSRASRARLPPQPCACACSRKAPLSRLRVYRRSMAAGSFWRFLSMFGRVCCCTGDTHKAGGTTTVGHH